MIYQTINLFIFCFTDYQCDILNFKINGAKLPDFIFQSCTFYSKIKNIKINGVVERKK